jgi:type II secretion system protein G
LIEIMVVVFILGLLVTLVAPRIVGRTDEARKVKAVADVKKIEEALHLYKLDNGTYPTTDQGLQALVTRPRPATCRGAGIPTAISSRSRRPLGQSVRVPERRRRLHIKSYGPTARRAAKGSMPTSTAGRSSEAASSRVAGSSGFTLSSSRRPPDPRHRRELPGAAPARPEGLRARASADRLATTARYLYDEAAYQRLPMRLNLDLDHQSYFVTVLGGDPGRAGVRAGALAAREADRCPTRSRSATSCCPRSAR